MNTAAEPGLQLQARLEKTLAIPESFENSAMGLYLVKDFHFLERPKDE